MELDQQISRRCSGASGWETYPAGTATPAFGDEKPAAGDANPAIGDANPTVTLSRRPEHCHRDKRQRDHCKSKPLRNQPRNEPSRRTKKRTLSKRFFLKKEAKTLSINLGLRPYTLREVVAHQAAVGNGRRPFSFEEWPSSMLANTGMPMPDPSCTSACMSPYICLRLASSVSAAPRPAAGRISRSSRRFRSTARRT